MAGLRFAAVQEEISTGSGAWKTLVQVVAASNHRVKVEEIIISFKGTSNTATPIRVDILRQTDAGTASALTLVKLDDSAGETLQTTAQHSASVEPSAGDVLASQYIHPQGGSHWQARFGGEYLIGGGDRLGVRVYAGADVEAAVTLHGEE